jgi:hypothetical protein
MEGVVTVPHERDAAAVLRRAGARFAFVHGSRATQQAVRPDSDLDVAAWWGDDATHTWEVDLRSVRRRPGGTCQVAG